MDRSVPSAIFTVDDDRVRSILHDYGIQDSMDTITELFRYNFSGRDVRLILKVTFKNRASMVIKLKNEKDLSREVVEQQSAFSAILERHGVPVAGPLQAHEKYTSQLSDGGRGVIVKVEEFREKELLRQLNLLRMRPDSRRRYRYSWCRSMQSQVPDSPGWQDGGY